MSFLIILGKNEPNGFCLKFCKWLVQLLDGEIKDISAIVEPQSQTDPSFKSTRLYTRLSAAEVRRQLIEQKGYQDEELPCAKTIQWTFRNCDIRIYPRPPVTAQIRFHKIS